MTFSFINMKLLLIIGLFILFRNYLALQDDSDDAEFADFDEDLEVEDVINNGDLLSKSPDTILEQTSEKCANNNCNHLGDNIDEEDSYKDEEEFENLDQDFDKINKRKVKAHSSQLKITKVPMHFRSNWDNYYIEMMMIGGLVIYLVNFITGKTKNNKLAILWLETHKDILEANFSLVGDESMFSSTDSTVAQQSSHVKEDDTVNPNEEDTPPGALIKESESVYLLWCSGRVGCEGALIELKLLKRQDIFSLLTSYFKRDNDKTIITVYMNYEDMDSYVLAVGNKKSINFLAKDMKDLSLYCPEKKSGDKLGLPPGYQILSEIGEATVAILDPKVLALFHKYSSYIDYIHFSDQFCGRKSPEENTTVKPQDTKKCLRFCFDVPSAKWNSRDDLSTLKPLLLFVFYCIDKVHRFRLSKEAKLKSGKNRFKVEDSYFRQQHTQRQEAAQVRREEKRKAEKERLLNEEDPNKQKKLEEKEYKRELKKRNPKFKQLKIMK